MKQQKKPILKLKFVILSMCCAVTVASAAVLNQTTFRTDDDQTTQAVFNQQNIGDTVDLTDVIAAQKEIEQAAAEQAAAEQAAAEQEAAEQAAAAQTINGLPVHAELPIVQPTLTPEQAQNVSITVNKSQHTLTLYSGDMQIAQYSVGLGSASDEGAKEKEGDKRTPEGEYYICVLNRESKFYLSLGLSYPNAADAERGLASGLITQQEYESIISANNAGQQPDWYTNLGGQIMIHGQKDDLGGQTDWTTGCVAVNNQVMDILWNYCQVGTKVTILP